MLKFVEYSLQTECSLATATCAAHAVNARLVVGWRRRRDRRPEVDKSTQPVSILASDLSNPALTRDVPQPQQLLNVRDNAVIDGIERLGAIIFLWEIFFE